MLVFLSKERERAGTISDQWILEKITVHVLVYDYVKVYVRVRVRVRVHVFMCSCVHVHVSPGIEPGYVVFPNHK